LYKAESASLEGKKINNTLHIPEKVSFLKTEINLCNKNIFRLTNSWSWS